MHEELNLRLNKPYIQNPESDGREINQLGLEHWSNTLRREWSFLYFMFYGSMRSSLTCKTCRQESSTFDNFSTVPVSLPEPTQISISIIVYRVPNKAKDIINGKCRPDQEGAYPAPGMIMRQDSNAQGSDSESMASGRLSNQVGRAFGGVSVHGASQRAGSSQSNRDQRRNLAAFADSYNYMTNDQPIKITLRVDQNIYLKELATKIGQIRECNIDSRQQDTEIIFFY